MRKLGLIGGTGYESTLVYYRELNRIVNERCGGRSFPEMSLESVDLYKALGYVAADNEDGLTAYLLDKLENLAAGGAEFAALTAGTMHIVFDRLKEKSPLPLVGIPQTVCDEAKRMGYRKVGLMGTIFTMEKDFFKSALTENGIEVIVPDKAQRELINQRITTELELGSHIVAVADAKYIKVPYIQEQLKAGRIVDCGNIPVRRHCLFWDIVFTNHFDNITNHQSVDC